MPSSRDSAASLAVDDVSLTIEPGQILGVLGPNGAGKTTTVSMIAGLLTPDAGEIRIDGQLLAGDRDPAKRKIGLVPQDLALYEELTAQDNLRFFGALYSLTGAALDHAMAVALTLVGLGDRMRDRVKTFSGGMKRRLNLAAGLLHDPDILLLDEPTVGVDPQSRNAIFDNLEELKDRGKALLYTTHYMEEAERLADRLVIIDRGQVVASDTLAGLYEKIPAAGGRRARLARVRVPLPDRKESEGLTCSSRFSPWFARTCVCSSPIAGLCSSRSPRRSPSRRLSARSHRTRVAARSARVFPSRS